MVKGRNIELMETEEIPQKVSKKEEKEIRKGMKEQAKPVTLAKDDFLETVTGIATTKEPAKTKKNGISTIVPTEDSIKEAVDAIVEAKKAEKEAKATKETKEAELIDYMFPIYEEDGFGSNFQKSYYVQGVTEKVTFVTSDKFSAPKDDEISALQGVFGDKFEQFIKKETELKVRPEIFSDKTLQKKLMELIPKEQFGEFFVAETRWSVADEFDRNRFSLPKSVFKKVMEILRQAKPSIK